MSNQDFSPSPIVTEGPDGTCQAAGPCCNTRPLMLSLLAVAGIFAGGNIALLADPSLAQYLPTLPGESSSGFFASRSSGECPSSMGCSLAAAALANCSVETSGCPLQQSSRTLTSAEATPSCCETVSRSSLMAFNCCESSLLDELTAGKVPAGAAAANSEDAQAVADAFGELPPAPALPEKL